MTSIETQIIDLQNKMDELQRKQLEVEQRKINTIDALFQQYNVYNNNVRAFIASLRRHNRNTVFQNIDSLTQKRFDMLFKIITAQNKKINELEKLINTFELN